MRKPPPPIELILEAEGLVRVGDVEIRVGAGLGPAQRGVLLDVLGIAERKLSAKVFHLLLLLALHEGEALNARNLGCSLLGSAGNVQVIVTRAFSKGDDTTVRRVWFQDNVLRSNFAPRALRVEDAPAARAFVERQCAQTAG